MKSSAHLRATHYDAAVFALRSASSEDWCQRRELNPRPTPTRCVGAALSVKFQRGMGAIKPSQSPFRIFPSFENAFLSTGAFQRSHLLAGNQFPWCIFRRRRRMATPMLLHTPREVVRRAVVITARFGTQDVNACGHLNWCQRRELNPRPKAYESSALPLSYSGNRRQCYILRTIPALSNRESSPCF